MQNLQSEKREGNLRTCSIEGCGRKHEGHGLCTLHLYRWKRNGDPYKVQKPLNEVRLKSDNLRPARLSEGLAVAIGTIFGKLP